MSAKRKVGDVVKLKSGGPKMVVTYLVAAYDEREYLANVCWTTKGTLQSAQVPVDCLVLA